MACCCCFIYIIILIAISVIFKLYLKLTMGWCRSQICLVGKTAIVTGANTGIGYEAALDFAKRGCKVILACRDLNRAEEAKQRIIKETNNHNIFVKYIDLSKFATVRQFAKDIIESEKHLDILVNNAGLGGIGKKRTTDGLPLVMQVNYFGPFLLTILLIDLLKETPHSRIVNVSSLLARWSTKLDLNNLDREYPYLTEYACSKLGNILFTRELAKRLNSNKVTVYSLHPGVVQTDIWRNVTGISRKLLNFIINLFAKTAEEGAQTTIYMAVQRNIEHLSGEHFENCRHVQPYSNALNQGFASKLWKKTEELVKLQPAEVHI